jgi:hypothetical protein
MKIKPMTKGHDRWPDQNMTFMKTRDVADPNQCMMVAAHSSDLAAAAALGLRTGHVGRPGERGPGTGETAPKGSFDIAAKNFEEFADKMGS